MSSKLKLPTKRQQENKSALEVVVAAEEPVFKVHTVSSKRKAMSPVKATKSTRSNTANIAKSTATKVTSRPIAKPVSKTVKSAGSKSAPNTAATSTTTIADGKVEEPPKKKKRPAWDTKGRLEDLENHTAKTESMLEKSDRKVVEVTQTLESSKEQIAELVQFKDSLENKVQVKELENKGINEQLDSLQTQLDKKVRDAQDTLERTLRDHRLLVDEMTEKSASLQRRHDETMENERCARQEIVLLKSSMMQVTNAQLSLETRLCALKIKADTAEELVSTQSQTILSQEGCIVVHLETIAALESKIREEETTRRKLHNTIQELKGNIRVFCRVRPTLVDEKSNGMSHLEFTDEKTIELIQSTDSASGNPISKRYPFIFDKVFQPNAKQATVFQEISQLVQSALDGYNVCIFAYGQTGSGKTFTMEGPPNLLENPEAMGMIPRAVYQIFDTANSLIEKGWTYTMEATFLEIYNDTIRDLLAPSGIENTAKLDIRHSSGKTIVTDAVTVNVATPNEVEKLLKQASGNRAVAATNCNERSSRSHSVFTLKLVGRNTITAESVEGILNLIDLAGSERLSSSQATGDRLKETQAINKSLSCIGDVIMALSNKDSHIPYRNSKLTYLLMNSLGGNSKTLMFVNVSPSSQCIQESLCSMRFALKVNSCQIGTARQQKK